MSTVETVAPGIETDPGRHPRTRNGGAAKGRGANQESQRNVWLYLLPALLLAPLLVAAAPLWPF